MSIDRWMDKEDAAHIYSGILLSHRKEWNHAICNNMDATRDYYTKWNKSERERWIPYDITYMWNLKYDTNEPIYETKRESWTQRTDRWLPRGWGRDGVGGWLSRHKLLYIQWISSKVLLDSTESYIQYPMINHNGKEYFKRNF